MRVLVIGANGKVGRFIVEKLKNRRFEPIAMIRKEEQAEYFDSLGVQSIVADLEEDFEHVFHHHIDAVVFSAGSGSHTGPDKTIIVDQEGAIESIDLAKKHGVQRYIMISALRADNPKKATSIKHYLYAKHRADEYLKVSGLTYTILRPGLLTDDAGSGMISLQEKLLTRGKISREDVASVVAHVLNHSKAYNQVFELIEGDTPISQCLRE